MRRFVAVTGITLSIAACKQECLLPPCPLPIALEVVVTSTTSGTGVPGTALAITGAESATVLCDSACTISGYAGTYTLNVTAPGYQAAVRTVVVRGSHPSCGCASTETQQVSFVLTPTP